MDNTGPSRGQSMKGLNARIKGVHKSKEGMWEEAGIQKKILKVD